jgi:hypothetical protein
MIRRKESGLIIAGNRTSGKMVWKNLFLGE